MNSQLKPLYEAASNSFMPAGRYPWHFARGKLRHDPVFFELLKQGLLPNQGQLFDLGCGQGILMALVVAARKQFAAGRWIDGWPAPPSQLVMRGIELCEDRVHIAQQALDDSALVEQGDIREANIESCSAVVLLDVLHFLNEQAQQELLERTVASLEPGGVLLLRESDAGAGVSFQMTQWAERIAGMRRGLLWQKLYFRDTRCWIRLLEKLGLAVTVRPMSDGTPFSNNLLIARRLAG